MQPQSEVEPTAPADRARRMWRTPEHTGVPVRLDQLSAGYSPRVDGVDAGHVAVLAEAEVRLPPILVHRPTMRVIDGMHRLHVARLAGHDTIEVEFFDGDEHEAFVLAVRANVAHGLPLTLADREAAALHILRCRPQTSDRFVATVTGLSAGTVGAIRRRELADDPTPQVRVGRDGRGRPVDPAAGRRLAREVLIKQPDASLRTIARLAGISPATARDVRERMRRGDDPLRAGRPGRVTALRGDGAATVERTGRPTAPARRDPSALLLNSLGKDPSLRFTESGRTLLRWLFTRADGLDRWEDLLDDVPPHCVYLLVDLAAGCAEQWQTIAEHLQRRLNAA